MNSNGPVFTAMTYNVAHGRGTGLHQTLVGRARMERNLQAIARQILLFKPHIVALQELDQGSFWNHRMDQLAYLKELTDYSHAHHGIHADEVFFKRLALKYGLGILSRLEPLDFFSRPFSLGRLDTKGFTSKRLLFHRKRLLVVALHLDFRRHKRRLLQVQQIIEHVQGLHEEHDHLIVMGDFNCTIKRESSPLRTLMSELDLHTFDLEGAYRDRNISFPSYGGHRLDYILVDRGLRFVEYATGNARLSDHEFVVARLRIRRKGHKASRGKRTRHRRAV